MKITDETLTIVVNITTLFDVKQYETLFVVTPLSTPGCEYQFGMYPVSDACSTTYIRCVHGHPDEAHCDPGLVYEAKSHTCVWPDQLLPYCNPEEIVGFKCPHKVPSHSAAAKFWPFPR